MSKKYTIGIIGNGFVGSAAAFGFSPTTGFNDAEILIYDKDPLKSTHSLEEVCSRSKVVFVSVPTPAKSDGSIDLTIIHNLFSDISNLATQSPCDAIFLLRSTVIPGTSSKLSSKFNKLKIVFNPEFLTERSSRFDFINQSRVILGGNNEHTNTIANLFRDRFGKSIPIIQTDFKTAELIKYMCNNYFALKIAYLNEMFMLAKKLDIDWEAALEGFLLDGRIGHSHTSIPGHDGKLGFGGSCFPKDIQAMIAFMNSNNLQTNTLEGAWKTNLKVRPEKDWEQLKGRAISENSD